MIGFQWEEESYQQVAAIATLRLFYRKQVVIFSCQTESRNGVREILNRNLYRPTPS